MLISELRKVISGYDKKELESIIAELYKRIPKRKKEDYKIDEFIKNIKIKKKSVKKTQTFDELYKEIIYFLECVDNEYYACSNKVISKNERSKWRFKVKRYYKELVNIKPTDNNGKVATSLLIELYKRLSTGSNILLFSNWQTFRAVGISQADYYDMLIKRLFYLNCDKENITKVIDLLDVLKDPYELSEYVFKAFIANIKSYDNQQEIISMLNDKIYKLKKELLKAKNSHIEFELKENINDYTICTMEIYCLQDEVEKGIKYFEKNYIEENKEVKEYILLKKLDKLKIKEYWLKEYEKKKDKIKLRSSIKERYEEIKKHENQN